MLPHLPPDAPLSAGLDCSRTRERLAAFVDGELAGFYDDDGRLQTAAVQAHVAHCPPCAQLEQQLRGMRRALRALGVREQQTLQAPPSLRARVTAMFASSPTHR
jgi:anti-sigma factor RsiW